MSEMVIIKCPECKDSFLPSAIEEKNPYTCSCGNVILEITPNVEEGEEDLYMISYVREKPRIKIKKNDNNT